MEYEKANESFIGFKINKGRHDIDITFEAPWFNLGKIFKYYRVYNFYYNYFIREEN